jgi:release factor glutamine methyltransferase
MQARQVAFADGPEGRFDIVVSNPPYIRSGDIPGLEIPVRVYSPPWAIDGGADGLDAYRAILGRIDSLLVMDGLLALEIGFDQGDAVTAMCRKAGLEDVRIEKDLAGHDRVVMAGRK